jgi:hypothetical protein
MLEPVEIIASVAVPCFGVFLVYCYAFCLKRRVGGLEERVGLLENRPSATAPSLPAATPHVVVIPPNDTRRNYYPPPFQYAPYPPYQQVPPRPSAPMSI